jgi:hypothetical protein
LALTRCWYADKNITPEENTKRREQALTYRHTSSSYWTLLSFFASQSLHNRIFLKKKSGDVNDEANFSLFILLQERAKPILPPYPLPPFRARTQTH